MVEPCPCGSKIAFNACCQPYLQGDAVAQTPLALMKSRYSAYVYNNANYLVATWHPEFRYPELASSIEGSASNTQWLGLTVIDSGMETPDRGYVEFLARYLDTQTQQTHAIYERSTFIKQEEVWYYTHGVKPRIGRNDPVRAAQEKI